MIKKTLADLKRDLKIGDTLILIDSDYTQKGLFNRLLDVKRAITIKQTNAIALATPQGDGTLENSWFQFPCASDLDYFIDDDNQKRFKIYGTDNNGLKYLSLEYAILTA